MDYPYKIPLRKKRLYLLAAISFFLFLAGLPLLFKGGGNFSEALRPYVVIAMAMNTLLFGGGAYYLFTQTRKAKEGLVINSYGIEAPSFLRQQAIPWEEITGVRSLKTAGTLFILIDVNDPESFITGAGISRRGLRVNLKRYGTPIVIPTDNLGMEHEALLKLLKQEIEQYRAMPEELRLELKERVPRMFR